MVPPVCSSQCPSKLVQESNSEVTVTPKFWLHLLPEPRPTGYPPSVDQLTGQHLSSPKCPEHMATDLIILI